MKEDPKKKKIVKHNKSSAIAKLMQIPGEIQENVEITVHKANIWGRLKQIEADMIIKFGLLRKKK